MPIAPRANVEHKAAVVSAVAVIARPEASAPPERTPESATQRPATKAPITATSSKPVAPKRPRKPSKPHTARGTHGKLVFDFASAEPPAATAKPAGRGRNDPFESFSGGAREPAAAKQVARATPEPAPALAPVKSQASRSSDSLDDLMNGVGGGSKADDKRSTSRKIDAMLKNVQKSDPPPPPKRAEPAPLPALTAADIARVMAGVKTNAKACGKRFGQNGVADLKLTVSRDGKVTDVAIRGKLADSPTGRCITQAARGATFSRSSGIKFDYRIDVR